MTEEKMKGKGNKTIIFDVMVVIVSVSVIHGENLKEEKKSKK